MFTSVMSAELAELAQKVAAAMPDPMPSPPPHAPRSGQSRSEWSTEVAAVRAEHDALADIVLGFQPPLEVEIASTSDESIPVEGGEIRARIYQPCRSGEPLAPAITFFHGGAWWMGGGENGFRLTDNYCRVLSAGTGAVVINVDYRLAPEFGHPHQLEDCYAATQWTEQHAARLGLDTARLSVMGASSGGNQAAAVCLLARERSGPAIRSQILYVPALDLTGGSPSMHALPGAWEEVQPTIRLYVTPEERTDPHVSPLLADDLRGLPPAVIIVGQHDLLCDDGHRYAARLREAGVSVRLHEYPMLHNIALPETTRQVFGDLIESVRVFGVPTEQVSA